MSRILLAVCSIMLFGCAPTAGGPTSAPTQTLVPRPGPQGTPSVPPPATIRPVETAGPTRTPFSHLIVEGDTLLGVALQYGVELNDLLLANPGVNPRFLTVGSALVVPLGGAQGPVPTATPRAVDLSSVNCIVAASGELWCFLEAGLAEGPPIEGVVGLVTLVETGGRPIRTEPAFSPLNLLRPGSDLPLVAYFAPPVPEYTAAVATILSAVSAGDSGTRYLPVEVIDAQSTISADQRRGTVAGILRVVSAADREPYWVRMVVLGLDGSGRIVGFTILDPGAAGRLDTGYHFKIEVASLGPPIATLGLLAEARASGS